MTKAGTVSAQRVIPARAEGSHFYRYSEFTGPRKDWLKELILAHQLYIPTITQLNDPTDGKPRLAKQSEEKLFQFLYNSPFGVLGRNPEMPLEEQIRQGLIVDYNIRNFGPDKLQREFTKLFHAQIEKNYRIYSLTKRYDNLGLWAKYAANHRGYCLEFVNDGNQFISNAKEVMYCDSIPMDVTNPEHRKGYWFFCKRPEWSGEEEVRIVASHGRNAGKYSINPSWISRIILGYKMVDSDEALIRTWATSRTPNLTVVNAKFDEVEQTLKLHR